MKIKTSDLTLYFGKYKGHTVQSLKDEEYLKWLAKPVYSGKFYKSLHSTEFVWKVPFAVRMAARAELEQRGYELIGERFEK